MVHRSDYGANNLVKIITLVKFDEFFDAGDSISVRAIPINEPKFALRSPVIGVSILQPSGRRQVLIPFEPFCSSRFYSEHVRALFEMGRHIIFQNGAASQHSTDNRAINT